MKQRKNGIQHQHADKRTKYGGDASYGFMEIGKPYNTTVRFKDKEKNTVENSGDEDSAP